jgi:hypothetical protein
LSFIVSSLARSWRSDLPSATDGALIERRREQIEDFVPVLELSFGSRSLEVSPGLNASLCKGAAIGIQR